MENQVLLKVDGLSRRFGGLVAIKDLSFEVRKGEILGLIGPNGAGKSTTFNVVSGYYKPSGGKLTFMGQDITGQSAARISPAGPGPHVPARQHAARHDRLRQHRRRYVRDDAP